VQKMRSDMMRSQDHAKDHYEDMKALGEKTKNDLYLLTLCMHIVKFNTKLH